MITDDKQGASELKEDQIYWKTLNYYRQIVYDADDKNQPLKFRGFKDLTLLSKSMEKYRKLVADFGEVEYCIIVFGKLMQLI